MRIFLSVDIPEKIKEKLVEVQSVLKKNLENENIRWEKPEKMHITLLFIGEVEKVMITELEEIIAAEVKKVEPFKLVLKGISTFPNNRRPRVIMADIGDPTGAYVELQEGIAQKLNSRDFSCSSPKPPHITIARVRKGPVDSRAVALQGNRSFEVSTFAIKESTLHPTGAEHKTISVFFLTMG